MGLYLLNAGQHPSKGKAETLAQTPGAETLDGPPASFDEIPEGKYLICVVDNGAWDAAGIAYSRNQFRRFTADPLRRPKVWLLLAAEVVEELSSFDLQGIRQEEDGR